MKKFLITLWAVLMVVFGVQTASADGAVWKLPASKFPTISTVLLDENLIWEEETKPSTYEKARALSYVNDKAKSISNAKVVVFPEDADRKDIVPAEKEALVRITITEWTYRWHKVPDEVYYENQSMTVTGKDGKMTTITVPVKRIRPGYSYKVGSFTAVYTVTDKDGKKIYEMTDRRVGEKSNDSMFKRSVSDFYKVFNKELKKTGNEE